MSSRAFDVLSLVLAVGLAACIMPGGQPAPLDDLPPPDQTPDFAEDDFFEPPEPGEPFVIYGVVRDESGRRVAGADVWVETADLRDSVNNIADYEVGRDQTHQVTDSNGVFVLHLDEGYFHLMFNHEGYRMARTEPVLNGAGADRFDVRLVTAANPKVVAHRGASLYAPENTLPAIQKAILRGADIVEVDVRVTRDDVPVLMHDRTVDRTTNGRGRVADLYLQEIQGLDAGAWMDESYAGTPVPTLHQAMLEAFHADVPLLIDFKSPASDEQRAWAAVALELRHFPVDGFIVGSFRSTIVRACASESFQCAHLVNATIDDPVQHALNAGATAVYIDQLAATWSDLQDAHRAGLEYHVWTVNMPASWATLHEWEVDGIVTDYPGHLLDKLVELDLAGGLPPP